jgi:tRNA pseudouridine38-40 synthase
VETKKERYFIEIAFNGTNYHGWQAQKNAISIQEVLDKVLSTIFREKISTIGCGRTDAGVHAKQLFAHFDVVKETDFDEMERKRELNTALGDQNNHEIKRFLRGINALLPPDIAAKALFKVKPDAHARFDAISRIYEYHIHFDKNPFLTDFSWQLRHELNVEKMNTAAGIMMEYCDFSCFSKSNTQVFTNNCEITFAEWRWLEEGKLVFEIHANRFLRNMVRAIVGTLIEIGKGNQEVSFIREVLESKNRSLAGVSVPACGLYLTKVIYPIKNNYL